MRGKPLAEPVVTKGNELRQRGTEANLLDQGTSDVNDGDVGLLNALRIAGGNIHEQAGRHGGLVHRPCRGNSREVGLAWCGGGRPSIDPRGAQQSTILLRWRTMRRVALRVSTTNGADSTIAG